MGITLFGKGGRTKGRVSRTIKRISKSRVGKAVGALASFTPVGRASKLARGAVKVARSKVGKAILAGGAAIAAAGVVKAITGRGGSSGRRRSRTGIPKNVGKWLRKKERELDKLAKAAKVMKKLSQLNFRASAKKSSRGVITEDEAIRALRK